MSPFARASVYKIGRLTSVASVSSIVVALVLVSQTAIAQEASPASAVAPVAANPASAEAAPAPVVAAAPPAPDVALQGRLDALEQRTHLLESSLASAQAAAAAGP